MLLVLLACVGGAGAPETSATGDSGGMTGAQPAAAGVEAMRRDHEVAVQAFGRGEYDKAARLFEGLERSAGGSAWRRRAAYGRACSLLAGAETQEAVSRALMVWGEWAKSSYAGRTAEDPRLLEPALRRLEQLMPKAGGGFGWGKEEAGRLAGGLPDKEQALERLHAQVRAQEEISMLERRLARRTGELVALRRQLEENAQQSEALRKRLDASERAGRAMAERERAEKDARQDVDGASAGHAEADQALVERLKANERDAQLLLDQLEALERLHQEIQAKKRNLQ